MSRMELMTTSRRPTLSLIRRLDDSVRSYVVGPYNNLKDPVLAKLFGAGASSAAGIVVTEANAFTFSAVYDAVNQISSDVAKQPLNLRKRRQNGGSDPFIDSKLYRLLKYEPNREMGSMVFRRTVTAHALTCHGGFAEIERDGAGRPTALWPLTPDRVRPFRENLRDDLGNYRLGPLRYEIDGGPTVLDAKDVIHLHGLGYDGYIGYSVIDKARQAIGLGLAAERFGATFFGNGSTFGGVLSTEQDLDPEQETDLRERIEKVGQGPDRAWRLLVLGLGLKYQTIGVTPSESQMNELRAKQIEEVARFFRMPPHRLGLNTPGTVSYASVEMSNLDYYMGCMLDWITLWEEELNRKLIPPLEARQQFIKHNANAFLRGDTQSRHNSYALLLDRGVYNADMVLDLEDMNPQPNGQGQMFLVQGAMVPKDKLSAIADAQVEKAQAQANPPTPPAAAPGSTINDEEKNKLQRRAEEAEAAALEARAVADQERARRLTADATGTVQATELDRLRASEDGWRLQATRQELIAEDLRADLARLEAAESSVRASLTAAEQAHHEAEHRAHEAEERATSATAARDLAVEQATESDARAREAAVRAESAEQEAVAARQDHSLAEKQRTEAERQATEMRALADAAAEERTRFETDATTAIAQEQAARAEAEQLRQAVTEAETARQHDAESRAAAVVFAAEAAQAAAVAKALAEDRQRQIEMASAATVDAEQSRMQLEAALAVARAETTRLEGSCTDLQQRLDQLQAHVETQHTTQETVEHSLRAVLAEAERERDAARQQETALETRVIAATEAQRHAEAQVLDVRRAEDQRIASVMAAHRSLIVDVMRRMVDRETERARRAQATPEKLRTWLQNFYQGHEELCIAALLPAVRVHLAWMGSSADPFEYTRSLVLQHVGESIRQIRAVLEGDAEDLATSLNSLLRRWEQDRPTKIADVVFQEELNHVRG